MTNHIAAMRNIVAGVEVKTGHLYGLYLSFDRIVDIINDALNSVEPDHEGNLVYRYKSGVQETTPYRILTIKQVRYTPNQWFVVKDVGYNSFGGLEVFRFDNWHKYPKQPRLKKDKRNGMIWEEVKPKGWE